MNNKLRKKGNKYDVKNTFLDDSLSLSLSSNDDLVESFQEGSKTGKSSFDDNNNGESSMPLNVYPIKLDGSILSKQEKDIYQLSYKYFDTPSNDWTFKGYIMFMDKRLNNK